MVLRAAPITIARKQDIRGELADSRIELAVHRHEELTFIHRVRNDATRVIRLIEGGMLAEAHSTLGGLLHAATRREAQTQTPDDGAAA